jgi:hypothetical protein
MLSCESGQGDGAHGAAFVDDHLDGRPLRLDDDGGHHRDRRGEVLGVALVVDDVVVPAAVVAALALVAAGLTAFRNRVVAGVLVDGAARTDHVALFDGLAGVEVVLPVEQMRAVLVVPTAVARVDAAGVAADAVARALDAAVVQLDDLLRHFEFSGKLSERCSCPRESRGQRYSYKLVTAAPCFYY